MVRTHLQNDARGEPLRKRVRRETRDLQGNQGPTGNQRPTATSQKPVHRWTQDFGTDTARRRSQHSTLIVIRTIIYNTYTEWPKKKCTPL